MSNMQNPLERAHYAAIDAETARVKAEQKYEEALAEETWEYAVQVSNSSKWLFLGPHPGGYRSAKGAYWFNSEAIAQSHRKFIEEEYFDTRIMRRRVSPPEVINE